MPRQTLWGNCLEVFLFATVSHIESNSLIWANLVLDGAVSLSFILITTANALVTPRELRGRVNAATTTYSSLVRGLAVLGAGVLAANGNPLPAFILLTSCFIGAALIAARR